MIYMHAGQRIFFNHRFPDGIHLLQGHGFIAGIIHSDDLLIFDDIGPDLSKENTVAPDAGFTLVCSDFLGDKRWRYSALNKYVLYFLFHIILLNMVEATPIPELP